MKTKQLRLVTYDQAKRLKALGFDWMVGYHYNISQQKAFKVSPEDNYNDSQAFYSAPTVALALKWFRDEKGLFGCAQFAIVNFRKGHYYKYFSFSDKKIAAQSEELFGKYEDAESALLDGLLSVLEKRI
jgi:hypothetical protein